MIPSAIMLALFLTGLFVVDSVSAVYIWYLPMVVAGIYLIGGWAYKFFPPEIKIRLKSQLYFFGGVILFVVGTIFWWEGTKSISWEAQGVFQYGWLLLLWFLLYRKWKRTQELCITGFTIGGKDE
jgi:hypothetical protein